MESVGLVTQNGLVSGLLEAVSLDAVAHGRCRVGQVIPVLRRRRLRTGHIVVACIQRIPAFFFVRDRER